MGRLREISAAAFLFRCDHQVWRAERAIRFKDCASRVRAGLGGVCTAASVRGPLPNNVLANAVGPQGGAGCEDPISREYFPFRLRFLFQFTGAGFLRKRCWLSMGCNQGLEKRCLTGVP